MPTLYFRHTATNRRFRVVSHDKATKELVLQGELATFRQTYDKEEFQRLGYVLESEPDPVATEDDE